MFICNHCGAKSNIITVPNTRMICPVCGNGELVLLSPAASGQLRPLNLFMQTVDWSNKRLLQGLRPWYQDTRFLWHCSDYWDKYIAEHGDRTWAD